MFKLSVLAATLVAVPVLAFAVPAFADSPGQLAGGPDIYQVRNVTKNTGYSAKVNATCNEVVKYSVKLSNTEYGLLSNVTVNASLAAGSMTATAKNAANETVSTAGNVTVSLDKGSLKYVSGTTQLFTVDGKLIKNLPDGVTSGGVNTGDLKGSTREFLQFQAKVTCDKPEEPKDIKVCELSTKKIITIKENQFNSSKHSKNLADCATEGNIVVCEVKTGETVTIKESEFDSSVHSKDLSDCEEETPEVLVNTGAGDILGLFAAVTVAGALAHRFVWTRIRG